MHFTARLYVLQPSTADFKWIVLFSGQPVVPAT